MNALLAEVRACRYCAEHLPHGPRPVIQVSVSARILIIRDAIGENLTETVRGFRHHLPRYLPLPHPSPRNRFRLTKNPWFAEEVLPALQDAVQDAL